MPFLPLSNGEFAIVDPDVLEWASAYRWHRHKWGVARNVAGGRGRLVWLRREVSGDPSGKKVTHRNGDLLDCRRGNLAVVDRVNTWKNKARGVCFVAQAGKWRAYVMRGRTPVRIGHFATEAEALAAREQWLREIWGEQIEDIDGRGQGWKEMDTILDTVAGAVKARINGSLGLKPGYTLSIIGDQRGPQPALHAVISHRPADIMDLPPIACEVRVLVAAWDADFQRLASEVQSALVIAGGGAPAWSTCDFGG